MAAFIILSLPLLPVLEISLPKSGQILWCRPAFAGQSFSLGFRHSVELSMVWDFFRLDRDYRLLLYETHFDSSNAGLPSVLNEGEKLILAPDRMRITNRNIMIPALQLWVHEKSLNTLKMNSMKLELSRLAGDGLIEIRPAKRALGFYLYLRLREIMVSLL